MDQHARWRRLADRERGLRRVRAVTTATGAGMVALTAVFAVSFAGTAESDGASATNTAEAAVSADPGPADEGLADPGAPTPPEPDGTSGTPRTVAPTDASGGLAPPTSAPTRISRSQPTTRRRSSSSSGTHARTGGS